MLDEKSILKVVKEGDFTMRRMLYVLSGILFFFVFTSLEMTSAQDRSLYWERWDVTIDNVDAVENVFSVEEYYEIAFTGLFSYGTVEIPADRLTSIEEFVVRFNGERLRYSCSSNSPQASFCARRSGDLYRVVYYFPRGVSDETVTISLEYVVYGAIRIYEGGDQIWWYAIPDEHFGYPIEASAVTVQLPASYAPREGVDAIETYGAPTTIQVNGSLVTATATNPIRGNESLEIRVQFPHQEGAVAPSWQAGFDSERDYEQTVKPLIDLAGLGLGGLLTIGGPLLVFLRYRTKGRDPEIGPVPEFLSEPPSDVPPAVVGTLVDEKVDLRDILSTLIDLGRRGYLVIEETASSGFLGIGVTRSFTFKRTDKSTDDLRKFEQRLMKAVFRNGLERTLESMRNTFYQSIPKLQDDLYEEVVEQGYFSQNPSKTRNLWAGVGTFLVVGSVLSVFLGVGLLANISFTLMLIPLGVFVSGLAMAILSSVMPSKTRKGAEEAAKWKAFQNYLSKVQNMQDLEEAAPNFERYLAYAVAFGLDKAWISKFQSVGTSIFVPSPPWYYPTHAGGRYGGGYVSGSPAPTNDPFGDVARAGDGLGGLDGMSGGLSSGLDSLSNGLSSMLDSASSVMTSRPQSQSSGSWSSGGGGFSGGGGSFGGGGSGGGSRGFG